MNKNIVVVYGSGASYASGYKVRIIEEKDGKYFDQAIAPPTDQKFFIEIKGEFLIKEEYCALWMFKNSFFGHNSSVGMEEVWTALDLNHKHIILDTYDWDKETQDYIKLIKDKKIEDKYPHSDQDSPLKLTGDCGRDFRRLIYNVYSHYEKPVKQPDCFNRLHEVLKKSSTNFIGYITFNYDCYLEDSLNNRQFKFKYINANSTKIKRLLEGGVPIIKLHGSLSWEQKRGHDKIIQHAFSSQVKPDYQNASNWSEPAIIPPTIFKQEINDDKRIGHPLTQIIAKQWRAAITILQEADIIIFVGYSFPASDFHAKRIFQISNMIRRKNKKQSMQILDCIGRKNDEKVDSDCIGPKKDENDEKRRLLKSIFGCDTDIKTVRGFDKLLESKELQELLSK